jgi:hypothetical protein
VHLAVSIGPAVLIGLLDRVNVEDVLVVVPYERRWEESEYWDVIAQINDRLEESETRQQQAQNDSLAQFSASPDLQNEFVGAVLGAMCGLRDKPGGPTYSPQRLSDLKPLINNGFEGTGQNATGRH